MEQNKNKLSPSEAVFGFACWITTRIEPVTASAAHDSGVWANLVEKFCKTNELDETRVGWEENLKFPIEVNEDIKE